MTETALEKAQRKFEQARAALDAIKAREVAAERKKDTRRKIVLGGGLLDLAKTDKDASALVTKLIAGLTRDQDRKLFEKPVRKEGKAEAEKDEAGSAPSGKNVTPTDAPKQQRPIPPMPVPSWSTKKGEQAELEKVETAPRQLRPSEFVIEPDPDVI